MIHEQLLRAKWAKYRRNIKYHLDEFAILGGLGNQQSRLDTSIYLWEKIHLVQKEYSFPFSLSMTHGPKTFSHFNSRMTSSPNFYTLLTISFHYINILFTYITAHSPLSDTFSLFSSCQSFRSSPMSLFLEGHFYYPPSSSPPPLLSLSISLFTIFIFINTKHLYIVIQLVLFILDNVKSYVTSHSYNGLEITCSCRCRPKAEPF